MPKIVFLGIKIAFGCVQIDKEVQWLMDNEIKSEKKVSSKIMAAS